ncbi:hypothetical protein GCM10007907_17210 [Chitinimonas prasina]|uniref:ESX-1 secretion system protein EccA1-like N-terminal domain-containing protein n=1 Tax=Chitinimonas prasina TaxID=1434937 RepID=A0ABQ5YI31_9NEIS|nr:tetratricopeptide repeat protein [Chitinimonas prasina]GLR12931.1 hypothetical protein GCM10007907_17210 [Chitinimonas prasina]
MKEDPLYLTPDQATEWAWQCLRENKLQDAENLCEKLATRYPEHGGNWYLRALVAQADGRHGDSLEYLGRVAHQPELTIPLMQAKGHAHAALGQWAESLEQYELLISLQPDVADGYFQAGVACRELGKVDEARRHFRRAGMLDESRGDAPFALGSLLLAMGQAEPALAAFKQAVARLPEDAGALLNLGLAYQAMEDAEAAERCYRQSLSLKPDFALAHANLGLLLQALGRGAESSAFMDEAIKLDPTLAQPLGR